MLEVDSVTTQEEEDDSWTDLDDHDDTCSTCSTTSQLSETFDSDSIWRLVEEEDISVLLSLDDDDCSMVDDDSITDDEDCSIVEEDSTTADDDDCSIVEDDSITDDEDSTTEEDANSPNKAEKSKDVVSLRSSSKQ